MDWLLSIISCIVLWLMGNGSKWGPRLGIVGQIFWIIYALNLKEYGLLLGIIAYTIVNVRNCFKWEKEKKE